MDINQIINLSVIGLFVIVAAVGFIRGIFKGAYRSLTDILFVLVNAVASVFISKGLASLLLKPQRVYDWMSTINESLKSEGLANALYQVEPYLRDGEFLAEAELGYVLALPIAIITPLLFMLVFFLMGLIFKIIKFIVQKLLIPKTKSTSMKILGGTFGAIRSVLALAIFIIPLIGYATYAVNTVNYASENIDNHSVRDIDSSIEEYEECVTDGAFGVISTCGGQWLFDMLSTTTVEDVDVSLVDETNNAIDLYSHVEVLTRTDFANLKQADIDNINKLIDKLEDSEYLMSLVSSTVSQVAGEFYEENELFGYELPYYGESLNPAVQTGLQLLSTMEADGLIGDLRTFTDVAESLVKYSLLEEISKEEGDIFIALENPSFYSDILISLYINERTRVLVPTIANFAQSVLYEVYENVNGKPYGNGEINKVDENKMSVPAMNEEGIRIALAIKEIRYFAETVEQFVYIDEIVKYGDFSALGRALNQIKNSVFFGSSYRFLLDALLKSDSCVKLGIFDKNFVENATKPDADMEQLLLSRQSLARLTMAMWNGDKAEKEEALKVLIEQAVAEDSDALKELAALENLKRYGVKGEKGQMISSITVSLADTIHTHEYVDENGNGSTEDEKHAEAEKVAHILTVITGAYNGDSSAENMFDNGDGVSKTGESTQSLIEDVLDSDVAMEMIGSAVKENAQDPYNIDASLSEADKAALESTLAQSYATSTSSQDKQAIKDIAQLFGVELALVP